MPPLLHVKESTLRLAITLICVLFVVIQLTGPSAWVARTAPLPKDSLQLANVPLTANQVDFKTWTLQGTTSVHVTLTFPDSSYKVSDWGQVVKSGSNFSADIKVDQSAGTAIPAVNTTTQIYSFGQLAAGDYTFTLKTSGVISDSFTFTVSNAAPAANPIDDTRQFVRQQYLDFLNREPDGPGWDFWTENITQCNDPGKRAAGQTLEQCIDKQRVTTSGAFFLSPEFQFTGYYVYRVYKGVLGRAPYLSEFTTDQAFVGNGIVVNNQLSGSVVNQNKANFANQITQRAEFKAMYDSLSNQQYVAKLFQTTGVAASDADKQALVNGLNANTETRATVLFKVVDGINVISEGNQQFTTTYGKAFYDKEFNNAFVQMEYFGYMRRDPDAPGYAFWLSKLVGFGNYIDAEMVRSFLVSPEYRSRFDQTCYNSISPSGQSFSAQGGSNSIKVTTGNGCGWQATSNASWITISSGGSGSGNGTVSYTVAANATTSARNGALTVAGKTFAVAQDASAVSGPSDVEKGLNSTATVSLVGVSETSFNAISNPVKFKIADPAIFFDATSVAVLHNKVMVSANNIQVTADTVTLNSVLKEGRNEFLLLATDVQGRAISRAASLWAGSNTINTSVVDENGQPASNVEVTATLGDKKSVKFTGTTVNGQIAVANLPNRTIVLDAKASGNRSATLALTGNAGSAQLKLKVISSASSVNNNDLSQGAAGWNTGSAPVQIIPHEEGTNPLAGDDDSSGAKLEQSAAAAVDNDLQLSTSGIGAQSISRTFVIKPGTKNVTVRYRFVTSEVPGGFFGSQYNDYFNVSIRSKSGGGIISESQSMNQLGLAAFDPAGRTAWRQVSLPVDVNGDTVQADITVANVGDGAYDSYVIVDLINEKKLAITNLALNDIDNAPLQYLSAAAHSYFGSNTRIHGVISIQGATDDALSSLFLDVIQGGAVVATANLSASANTALIRPFGAAGKLEISTSQLLFELPSAEAAKVSGSGNGTLTLRVRAKTGKGEEETKEFGAVEKLVRYTNNNRYPAPPSGARDESRGGDDWVKPSVKVVTEHFTSITWGDFSNMNAGSFAPDHQLHNTGNDVDGWFNGYNNLNAATAAQMIAYLNDPTYGSRIEFVYVTFVESNSDPFWLAIKDVTLNDGRKASRIIRRKGGHTTHFHWRISD